MISEISLVDIRSWLCTSYSHLFNKRGGWNKCEGGSKNAKLLNMEIEVRIFLKNQ